MLHSAVLNAFLEILKIMNLTRWWEAEQLARFISMVRKTEFEYTLEVYLALPDNPGSK